MIHWDKSRRLENNILVDIETHFIIQNLIEVSWSHEKFSENLSRFYRQHLPSDFNKEKRIGKGEFLLVILEDPIPTYLARPNR